MFAGLRNLQAILCGSNLIKTIEANTFRDQSDLKVLYLDSNSLERFDSEMTFAGLGNLKQLHLESNNLLSVGENVFAGLVNLTALLLNKNKIERIESKAFQGLKNLEYLYLDNNQIGSIDRDSFDHLVALKLLSGKFNPISANFTKMFPAEFFEAKNLTLKAYF
jgi:Leucine-rich repeat (LRR) protein